MRLIDADKLREKLIIDYEVRETYFGEILLKEIDESPTVENITVFCENADEKTIEDLKAELQSVIEARPQGEWIPVSERLPEEKINPYTNDFDEVLCTTDWGEVIALKFGTPILHHEPHFWLGGAIMDEHIIAWQYKPEPYQKGGTE